MKLELPYPPGVNSLYGVRAVVTKGRPMAFPYKTHEHRNYSEAVRLAALEAGVRGGPQWMKPASVGMVIHLFRPRRVGDIDGPLKTLLDVLQGVVFENDDQVARLEVHRHDDKVRPRVELEVTELVRTELPLEGSVGRPVAEALFRGGITGESMPQRMRRLAKPAHVDHRGDDE